ncbi:MAG: IclR family transcriptional regulator [Rhodobacteraceae bacterium]|nr:IclR family transcriptional regulator [Paracoccaceae bacterium]MCY4196110.1 IclR family transcriptional regulator [Paracoccaceae bacterium]
MKDRDEPGQYGDTLSLDEHGPWTTVTRQSKKRIGAIHRALQILDLLTERAVPMSTYELARTLGAPASTIYKITDELVNCAMLTRDKEGRIWLGPRLMRYGLTYRARMDAFVTAKRVMERLCTEIGETVQICARDEDMMSVIGMARGKGHFNVASDVGTRVPLNWTASGRLLLGHLPHEERRDIFERTARPSETGLADTDPDLLARISGDEFKARVAVQMGASEYAVACIASPIRDTFGACQATISIVLPESRAQAELPQFIAAVTQAAQSVERAIILDGNLE